MKTIGSVESLWRYPVKSMRGEERSAIFAGFAGIYLDRLFAFRSSTGREGFPYFTARNQRQMLRYRPRFRQPEKTIAPPNLTAAAALPPGATPLYADPQDLMLDVETPAGDVVAIDDPALIDELRAGLPDRPDLTLLRSERALTDCRPLSLISVQSITKLAAETGCVVDKLRFRANIYLDLTSTEGSGEEELIGRSLRIGSTMTLAVVARDPRCMIVTLHPETAEKAPAILKTIAQNHAGMAGVYAAVLAEGIIRQGDAVELLD